MKHPCAFTVDVEDGISIAMRDAFHIDVPQTTRVVTYTRKILQLLAENSTRGTFFVLGKTARDFPFLVNEIAAEGHEVGVHGFHHLQFFRMTYEHAYQELNSAKKLIEDILGKEVHSHRAPAFSINQRTAWGLDVVAEAGFKYDTSIMPFRGRRYGWPQYPKDIRIIETPKKYKLIEAPLSTIKILGKEIPFSGGGYLRMFPFSFTKKAFEIITVERPVILYVHPYELDNERYPDYFLAALQKESFLKQIRIKSNWINRKTVFSKLEKLLHLHSFDTLSNVIEKSDL